MEKYYTPKINEFHVDFQFEQKERFTDGTVKTQEDFDAAKWIPMSIDSINHLPYIERALMGKNAEKGICGIRVKYLDHEDIESEGWTCATMEDGRTSAIIPFTNSRQDCDTAYLLFNPASKWILISQGKNSRPPEERIIRFSGYIQNISEFRRLLKQLDIHY